MTIDALNRTCLKQASQDIHAQTERLWAPDNLFSDKATYLRWLTALSQAHQTLGLPAAESLSQPDYVQTEQSRHAALCCDLAGSDMMQAQPENYTLSWSWGVLYALNGSAMGASILLKSGRISKTWPINYLTCMRRFAQSGDLKTFFTDLNSQNLDMDEASKGTEQVFALLSASESTAQLAAPLATA